MPLVDIECSNGHLTEVLKRGAVTGPFACPTCHEDAVAKFPAVNFNKSERVDVYDIPAKRKPRAQYFGRMGGGRGYRDSAGNERPALTHNAKCPVCMRYRNVSVMNEIARDILNLMCEACGYSWFYRAADASDPMFDGVVEAYRPGKRYSKEAPAGSGYEQPRRAG